MPEYTALNYASVLHIYDFITAFLKTEKRSPSPEEIAAGTDTPIETVRRETTQLIRSGNLKREKGVLTLVRPPERPLPGVDTPNSSDPGYVDSKMIANNGRRYFE